jgi:hypothetical protein
MEQRVSEWTKKSPRRAYSNVSPPEAGAPRILQGFLSTLQSHVELLQAAPHATVRHSSLHEPLHDALDHHGRTAMGGR